MLKLQKTFIWQMDVLHIRGNRNLQEIFVDLQTWGFSFRCTVIGTLRGLWRKLWDIIAL